MNAETFIMSNSERIAISLNGSVLRLLNEMYMITMNAQPKKLNAQAGSIEK
jgi:hypothetical protein